MSEPLEFLYRNHRGVVAARRVEPLSINWGRSPFHEGHQWLMEAYDLDKQAPRTFAMKDILGPPPVEEVGAWPPGAVPLLMPREELIGVLEGLIALIRADDSMEGSIQYSWGDEPGHYKVGGIMRVGNSMGQGGVRLLWAR